MRFSIPILASLALVAGSIQPARAIAFIDSVDWFQQPGTIPVAAVGGSSEFGDVTGTQSQPGGNAGAVFAFDWSVRSFVTSIPASERILPSINEGVVLGSPNNVNSDISFSFNERISNVLLYGSFGIRGTALDFGALEWTLVSATNFVRNGSRLEATDSANNTANDGFVVSLGNNFFGGGSGDLAFQFLNASQRSAPETYLITFGATTEAPGPIPVLGAAAAFGWSRRLRKRIAGTRHS
jgi:hypothetical protein